MNCSFKCTSEAFEDDSSGRRRIELSFVSAVCSHSSWRYALPPHREVCDRAEGQQDVGRLCYTPHPLALQPFLADGKTHFTTYHVCCSVRFFLIVRSSAALIMYCPPVKSEVVSVFCPRFQVLYWWWHCPAWGISCSYKAPGPSAHFPAPSRLCSVTAGVPGLSEASTSPGVISFTTEFSVCPSLWRGQQWYIHSIFPHSLSESTSVSHSHLSFLKVKVVASSSIRRAKRSQNRQNTFTAAELVSYVGRRVSDFTGQRRKARADNRVEGKVKKEAQTSRSQVN